jgi:hypothetical protein
MVHVVQILADALSTVKSGSDEWEIFASMYRAADAAVVSLDELMPDAEL